MPDRFIINLREVRKLRKNSDNKSQDGNEREAGILRRVKGAANSAKQGVVRSAEVMSGADIRRFEDFTDAATTAIVGVHQDQAELRRRLTPIEQSVADVQRGHAELRERLTQTEQSVADVRRGHAELGERLTQTQQSIADVRREQAELGDRLTRVEDSMRSQSEAESGGTGLSPLVIAFGVMSVVALVLSVVAGVV
jgi:chromosome segregation ATPase